MSNKRKNRAVSNAVQWAVDVAIGNAAHWKAREVTWGTLWGPVQGISAHVESAWQSALKTTRSDDLKLPALRAFLREESARRKAS